MIKVNQVNLSWFGRNHKKVVADEMAQGQSSGTSVNSPNCKKCPAYSPTSMNTVLRIGQPKPVWDGLTANGSKGFYRFWSDKIPDSITRALPDKCQTLFNWIPGRAMTMKLPDPNKLMGRMGVKTVQDPENCWRVYCRMGKFNRSLPYFD